MWKPNLKSQQEAIERVQRKFTKFIPGLRNVTYSKRLEILHLPSLKYRRIRGDLIQTFKILNKMENVDPDELFNLETSSRLRGHKLKLKKSHCTTKIRQNFFTNRIINDWNALPDSIIESANINIFKNGIDNHYKARIFEF